MAPRLDVSVGIRVASIWAAARWEEEQEPLISIRPALSLGFRDPSSRPAKAGGLSAEPSGNWSGLCLGAAEESGLSELRATERSLGPFPCLWAGARAGALEEAAGELRSSLNPARLQAGEPGNSSSKMNRRLMNNPWGSWDRQPGHIEVL